MMALPLIIAAFHGHLQVVQILLAKDDIEVNKANNDGVTPLYYAAYKGNLEVVQSCHLQKTILKLIRLIMMALPLYIMLQILVIYK